MRYLLLLLLFLAIFTHLHGQEAKNLRCEYFQNPVGIDAPNPKLSWIIDSDKKDVLQTAYHIQAAGSLKALEKGGKLLWDSGKVTSGQSIHVVYQGPPLSSRQRVYWRVKVWTNQGGESPWSEAQYWEMGLMKPADWAAQWIEAELPDDITRSNPAQYFRKNFKLKGKPVSARAYVTSHGLYEAFINGKRVGDWLFTPGWTSYNERLQYQVYDVTGLLQQGANAIGATLGDGWYRGVLAWGDNRNHYGTRLALLMQLEVQYADGSREVIATDGSWKASHGPILSSEIYDGEVYDARKELDGWALASYSDAAWAGVRTEAHNKQNLVAQMGLPVGRIEEVKPVQLLYTPAGDTVVDLGQNMVGWLRLKMKGQRGQTVRIRHAEVLDKNGNFYTDNLRAAGQRIEYIFRDDKEAVFEPHFTFMGFRYVAISGLKALNLDDVTGIVIHSAMEQTGSFECSDARINQLQHNIQWGQKGNFLDVPTDCPQRDERLGWTGDAQVFSPTAAFNYQVAPFFRKWLQDLAADQFDDGMVPHVIPHVLRPREGGCTGWADASTIIPWAMYQSYGDRSMLEAQYPSMQAWVDYMQGRAEHYVWRAREWHWGDWLSYNSPASDGQSAVTDKDFLCTAFFAYSTDIMRKTTAVLGKKEDEKMYAELWENIRKAFQKEFLTGSGRLSPNTQTAYAIALYFGLLPEDQRVQAAERLAADVHRRGDHISTGFLGTPYICFALSQNQQLSTAYSLLLQETYPSWLYPIGRGATTIWERWDGIKPDSSFQDVGMNSFNHYAYGAIGHWMYSVVAGIEIGEAGYKHILIQPQPDKRLGYARASLETMYGPVSSGWKMDGRAFELEVAIPCNTTATIRLPDASVQDLSSFAGARQEGPDVVVEVGSGQYVFRYNMKG